MKLNIFKRIGILALSAFTLSGLAYAESDATKATVKLVVNGEDCPLSGRCQYQLLLDKTHEMADIYAEELNEPYIAADLLPRLYQTASATIPAGLSANNLAVGVDLDEEASVEVEPGVYDAFLLESYAADWLGKDIIRKVQIKDGYSAFYVDNVTLQAGLTYTFTVTFNSGGSHGELIMPVDLQLKDILGENKPSCQMDSMLVRLSIANIGSVDVEQYEVYYAVGNDTVRDTVKATLAAGKDTVFTFAKKRALKIGEKTVINAAVLAQGEVALEDNFGHYTALRTASATLPVQINTSEMHSEKAQDWQLDKNDALVASKNASTPIFSTCFHIGKAGNYRLEYEYICGRYVEMPDGEVFANNIDKYKIRIGKSSENWQEWPVVVNDSAITGSSNYDEFTPKEVFFEVSEPGDYAFCIYAETVNDEDNLKFRNMQVNTVKEFDARFDALSVFAPRIIPQDWGNATHKLDLSITNRGLKRLDSTDIVILVNDREATRQAITLGINERQTLTVDVPVSGFKSGQTISFSGKLVRKTEVLGETGDLKAELLVSENTAAFDHITDFSSVKDLQSYTGARIGLIYPVVKTDTITALSIGWSEMTENVDIRIAVQRIGMEEGKLVLGDMIHQSTVRRGLTGGIAIYDIPAYLLTPGDYFISVEQLGRTAFALAMDEHPDGGFYSYDIAQEKWNYYTQAGYPAIRTVFGSNGKLITEDAMVTAISKPIAGGIFADNEPIVVSVRNNGIETAEIPVYVRVDNTVLEPKTVTVASYATVDVTFNANLAAKDADRNILITAFTAFANDKDRSNDTLTKEVISFVPADPYRMDFESCLDFATEGFNPAWTSFSFDNSPVLPLRHVLDAEFHYVDFPGSETDLGFIAFNPYATEPSMLFYEFYNACRPHSGQRFGASLAISNSDVNKDDWLVSPKLKMPAQNTQLSMWVRSFGNLRESYEIWVSQGSGDPMDLDFVRVYPEDDYETLKAASEKWENVVFNLNQYNGKDIHVAIRCMSPDATMFMIDDIVIGENAANEQAQSADFRVTVHPNPVQDMLTILSPDASIKEVAIFNLSGMLIHQSAGNLGTGNYRFNASGLMSGMYFARITTDKGTAIRKFIVR
ncbi:MAG: T9SS type A sorting domain-containing protein [Bacteroidales bacterium]|nr:T9SS type A sorting domain-containing protein [Bacteroidales bacterium]